DRKHPFFWVALGFGTVILLLYVFGGAMITEYGSLGRGFGWSYVTKSDGCYVNYVGASGSDSDGRGDKLQVGDKVLAINDDTIIGSVYPLRILREIPPDGAYTVRVLRSSSEHVYSFTLSFEHDTKNFIYIFPKLLVGIAFFVVGFLIGVLKPEQRIA